VENLVHNHVGHVVSTDFFTVPTITMKASVANSQLTT
jgi:hypothetical protein